MSRVSAILDVSVILIVALIMPNLARHALTDVTMDSRTITPCQCNDKCADFHDCCPDYDSECSGGGGGRFF